MHMAGQMNFCGRSLMVQLDLVKVGNGCAVGDGDGDGDGDVLATRAQQAISLGRVWELAYVRVCVCVYGSILADFTLRTADNETTFKN